MKCINPYRMKNPKFPDESKYEFIDCACGKCYNCLVNRRYLWLFRLTNEALHHNSSWFITLTYDDEHLPSYNRLVRKEIQSFNKRLRNHFPFKCFYIGEYGTNTKRAHFHEILFTDLPLDSLDYLNQLVHDTWSRGFVNVQRATIRQFNYILHYHVRPKRPFGDFLFDGMSAKEAEMECFQGFSKGLGLQFLFNPDGSLKSSLLHQLETTNNRIVQDIYSRTFVIPRYYVKKLKDLGFPVKEQDLNIDYSDFNMKSLLLDILPDLEFDSVGHAVNYDDNYVVSLISDIMNESKRKLKRYDYQTKTSV